MNVTLDADQELSHFRSWVTRFIRSDLGTLGPEWNGPRTTGASGEDVDSVYDNYETHFIVTHGIRDRKDA